MTKASSAFGFFMIAGLLFSISAAAHHSYAMFDRCNPMTIAGEIDSVSWSNPHIVIVVTTDDSEQYRVEWFDLRRSRVAGIRPDMLSPGDRVSITGAPSTEPGRRAMTLLSEIRRESDSWRWSRSRRRPRRCDM